MRKCTGLHCKVCIIACQSGQPVDHWDILLVDCALINVGGKSRWEKEAERHGGFGGGGIMGDSIVAARSYAVG
eukprot:scaffold17969_cov139-Skeletonema_marinoi.AAC.1